MRNRTYGKWHAILTHTATINEPVTVDTIDDVIAGHYPNLADLLDDYEIRPDGTTLARFSWVGDVHAHEDEIEAVARQLLTDDGYPADKFTLDEDTVDYRGYDPADYHDC